MEQQNAYVKPVTLRNIFKFAVPTIAMTVFMSFYTMVDGLFVSNLIGTDALSAINLTAPVISLVTAVSTMLATGGSAVIMKKMGEKKSREAREDFTFLILVNVVVGLVMCAVGYRTMHVLFAGMHLSTAVDGYFGEYLSRYLIFTVPILLMNNFTLYMIASEKATLSLVCSVTGGVLNMALDYVFLGVLGMGIGGAAIATGLGYSVTAVAGLDDAPLCRGGWRRGGHDHHVCADVRELPVYRIFLRGCAHDQLLLRGAEPGKIKEAGGNQLKGDRVHLCRYGCGVARADKAAGIRLRAAGQSGF